MSKCWTAREAYVVDIIRPITMHASSSWRAVRKAGGKLESIAAGRDVKDEDSALNDLGLCVSVKDEVRICVYIPGDT